MSAERWETIHGIRTRLLEAGRGNPEKVIFIHGLGSSADRWLDIPLALSLYYHTLALDLPGFGMSERPDSGFEYTIEEYSNYLTQLIRKLGFGDQKLTLVGHSLGGYIAAETTIRDRSIVDNLVLIDSSGMLKEPTELLTKYLAAALNPTKELIRPVFEQLVANPSRIPEVLVDGFIYRMNLPGAKNAFKLAYENSVNSQIGLERLGEISGIKTLIMWGKEDRLIPLEYHEVFHSTIKGSTVALVEDAGHAPFAEKPAVACEIIHRFLRAN